jgi:hypothetical protein
MLPVATTALLCAAAAYTTGAPAARAGGPSTIPVAVAAPRPASASIDGGATLAANMHTAVRLPNPEAAMPVGDLPGWRQIFTDDLTSDVASGRFPAAVATKWGAYPSPWKDSTGFGTYSPQVVDIGGGVLTEHIRTTNGVPMVVALTPNLPGTAKHGVQYGRFAARVRADPVAGYKLVMMLWPDSGDNEADGEIDFPEMNLSGTTMWGFVHRAGLATSSDQAWFVASSGLADWHTIVVEWSPDLVVLYLDGVEVGRTTVRVPSVPMHWVMQTETALHATAPPPADAAGTVQVDWAAAWAYDPAIG